MMPINYQLFFKFYLENKDKIFMKSGDRSINQENVEKWLKNIQLYSPEQIKETYLFFANTFIEFLLYVPFEKFYRILNDISLEIKDLLTNNNYNYEKIYFFIPDNIHKSNLWVSLLILNCLINNNILNEEIQNKIFYTNSYNDIIIHSDGKKSLCLYCDDMSYTGSQIYSNFVIRKKQPNLIYTNVDKYILISYLSDVAKEKLSKISNIHFFKSTINVQSYINQLKIKYAEINSDMVNNVLKMFDYYINDNIFQMGRIACSCNTKYVPIYFDHKIADELSTFNKLLFTGSYPIDKNSTNTNCEINPLINGCENNLEELSKIFGNPCIESASLDSEIPCFVTFYKTILYTFNNIKINSDNDENIVEILTNFTGGSTIKKKNTYKRKSLYKTYRRKTISNKNKTHRRKSRFRKSKN
jgi:hypothetical protein